MLTKAMGSFGRSLMEADADIYARFAILFAIGVAGIVAFYGSLLATVQILATEASGGPGDSGTPTAIGLAVLLALGLGPILRFLISDVPDLARKTLRENGHYLAMGALLVISCLVLLLA